MGNKGTTMFMYSVLVRLHVKDTDPGGCGNRLKEFEKTNSSTPISYTS